MSFEIFLTNLFANCICSGFKVVEAIFIITVKGAYGFLDSDEFLADDYSLCFNSKAVYYNYEMASMYELLFVYSC